MCDLLGGCTFGKNGMVCWLVDWLTIVQRGKIHQPVIQSLLRLQVQASAQATWVHVIRCWEQCHCRRVCLPSGQVHAYNCKHVLCHGHFPRTNESDGVRPLSVDIPKAIRSAHESDHVFVASNTYAFVFEADPYVLLELLITCLDGKSRPSYHILPLHLIN